MDGTKLKKFDGCVLHTANDDGERGEDNAIAIQEEDRGDGFKDGRSNGSDDHDGHDDRGVASEDSNDENVELGTRAVQLLAIRANFQISAITAYDWCTARCIYRACEWEVQEEGMVDLLPTGPGRLVEAYGFFSLGVFTPDDIGSCIIPPIIDGWYVGDGEEVEEYTQTIYGGLGRKVEITYLVVPEAIETYVDVALNLKDLGSRSRAVYGSIKASTIDYGSKRVQLFSCERGRSLSFPCGSTSDLPLSVGLIALPYRRHFKLRIEVDLRVITTCSSQEEDKNLKFCPRLHP